MFAVIINFTQGLTIIKSLVARSETYHAINYLIIVWFIAESLAALVNLREKIVISDIRHQRCVLAATLSRLLFASFDSPSFNEFATYTPNLDRNARKSDLNQQYMAVVNAGTYSGLKDMVVNYYVIITLLMNVILL